MGGFASAPKAAGVSLWEISRIGTRISGREPFDVDLSGARQRLDGGLVHVRGRGDELGLGVHVGSFAWVEGARPGPLTLPPPE
jgi:hypothetical protein